MVRLLFILAIVVDDLSDIFGGEVFVGRVEEMRDVFVALDADGAAYPLHELGGAETVEGYDVAAVGLLVGRLWLGRAVDGFAVDVVAVVFVGGYVEVFEQEVALARKLLALPAVFELTLNELRPHYLCIYLYELAGAFSTFYNADKVMVDDEAVKARRLMLCSRTLRILETGLRLLGIEPLEKM